MGRRNYTFDANMVLDDGVAAHGAAGWGSVGGAQGIVDLGGNQGITITLPAISDVSSITPQQARGDFGLFLYNIAATLSGSNVYRVWIVGSNNAGLASSNAILGGIAIGQGAGMDPPNCGNSLAPLGSGNYPAGWEYEIPFTNEQANTVYEFVALYIAGTFGSITFNAAIGVLQRT
jgi:hypothetical protein